VSLPLFYPVGHEQHAPASLHLLNPRGALPEPARAEEQRVAIARADQRPGHPPGRTSQTGNPDSQMADDHDDHPSFNRTAG
jgi:hypothetical protein